MSGDASLRVVFFGTPAFAVPSLQALLQSTHQVIGLVSQPDRPRGRGQQLQPTPTKEVALAHGVPVLQPAKIREEPFLDRIRALAPDLGVVVAFGRILPDALIAIPRLGMINVHASLLPKYRGAAPIQRAVLAGERQTGVTIMRIASEMDAGAIFTMRGVPIPPDATSGDMEGVLARAGAELLIPVVDDLASGRAVETPQDHRQATYAPKMTKGEGAIDWTLPADVIHNRVRGLQPWPLASTTIGGIRHVIRRSATVRNRTIRDVVGSDPTSGLVGSDPGTVLRARGDDLIVACGDGTALAILEIQPEGRRKMTARDFLAGRGVAEGQRLGA